MKAPEPGAGRVRGVSIAEVLVSLVLLALGATLSLRVLASASRTVEEAELGLRAAIFLSEIAPVPDAGADTIAPRASGPGWLIPEVEPPEALTIRYEPPDARDRSGYNPVGPQGFLAEQSWDFSWAR